MSTVKSVTIKMHTTFSAIDGSQLFCLDLLDAYGKTVAYTKWARNEQDNVTLALRGLLASRDVTGPAWHTTPSTDREFVGGDRSFGK